MNNDPHKGQPVLYSGAPIDKTDSAMILIHGRGSTADNILALSEELNDNSFCYTAPQAAGNTWYPYSFLAPVEYNEPGLSSGLKVIDDLIKKINDKGIESSKIILLGFSQGACLVLEYACRNAEKFMGVIGLSGGLIGEIVDEKRYSGNFNSTPVFLGCSDIDPHIPKYRVDKTEGIMKNLGAVVTKQFYKGMGHTINEEEIEVIRTIIKK
jgi:phospholipase/carboxylesterase